MPTIDEMSYGYNQDKVAEYVAELQAIVLNEASTAVADLSEITMACDQNWEGKAKQDFIDNVRSAADHVSQRYIELFQILNTEISNIQASMSTFDSKLIN